MGKPFVFITRKIPDHVLSQLKAEFEIGLWEEDSPVPREVLLQKAQQCDGLYIMLTDRVDEELLAIAPRLKAISTMSVGLDHIDLDAVKKANLIITHTPEVLTETTADLTFALLMATGRRIVEASQAIYKGEWSTWSPDFMVGQDIYGKTLGIIGLGRIGEAVARRARGFGMNLLYHNRSPRPEAEKELGLHYRSLSALLEQSDYIVLLTPATSETKHLIGRNELNQMKRTAIFINVSRGTTVDEEALIEALREKKIAGAGLDVFSKEPISPNHPLTELPQAVLLPHIGSATIETRTQMAELAAEGLIDALSGRKPRFTAF